MPVWQAHCRALLTQWLGEDFTWAGLPLAHYIAAIIAHLSDGQNLPLWGDETLTHAADHGHPAGATLGSSAPLPDQLAEAQHDPWHPVWCALASAPWRLEGRWLHPETACKIDQFAFAGNVGNLLIGCVDRANPAVRKPLNPHASPYGTDQGVIAVPLFPFRTLHFLQQGFDPEQALLLLAGTSVTEFGVHEALETFQRVPGTPVWDPHDSIHPLTVTITWTEPKTATTGWPILPIEE